MQVRAGIWRQLRSIDKVSGTVTLKICFTPSPGKGSTLKGNNERILTNQSGPPFQKGKGNSMQENKQQVTKVVSLAKWRKIYHVYPVPLGCSAALRM